jgi:hypothetical protein
MELDFGRNGQLVPPVDIQWNTLFAIASRPALRPAQSPTPVATGGSLDGDKAARVESWPLTSIFFFCTFIIGISYSNLHKLSSAVVIKWWSYISTSPSTIMACTGANLPSTLQR